MHPEDAPTRLQKSLGGRLARSVRIFSRAVVQNNRDLRFFLILVAFGSIAQPQGFSDSGGVGRIRGAADGKWRRGASAARARAEKRL